MKVQRISVIGLGKLGSCYTAFLASRGFTVVGVDVDQAKVRALNDGSAPVVEPGLANLVKKNRVRLNADTDAVAAVRTTDATFIIVPTPSKENGSFSLKHVLDACKKIGVALRDKNKYHLVSIVSTVLPGDSREYIIPTLEKYSGKKCGKDFGYCYNPSLIAIGDIIKDLSNPDFLFLGAYDKKAETVLADIFASVYPGILPERMSIESAEVAKIALNSYITTKITFANMLGEVCERLQYANVDHVTTALGKDKRIGSRYLKSGMGYGGPCFPRDNFAFAYAARRRGLPLDLPLTVHKINSSLPKKIAKAVESLAPAQARVGLLGVSYKPGTTMVEDSQALEVARLLMHKGYRVSVYEPLGHHEAARILGNRATYPTSLQKLVSGSDVIFVSNKDDSFALLPTWVKRSKKKKIVIDPWGMFSKKAFGTRSLYVPLGRKLGS